MSEKLGLSTEAVTTSVEALRTYLADSNVLYVKTQHFHWNVVSRDFVALHELFQKQYEDLAESIDETAERVRSLGENPVGSLREYIANTTLNEKVEVDIKDTEMITCLLDDHESMCRFLREKIGEVQSGGDEVTADYFISRLSVHEKTAWFLRSMIVV